MKTCLSMLLIVIMMPVAAAAVDYTIQNPADKIDNPAGRMSNPADRISNPAAQIANPAARIALPDPVVPLVNPTVQVAEPASPAAAKPVTPTVPKKYYTFKKVSEYLNAAKKAFVNDDYIEFVAVTEDALRRIKSGGMNASRKTVRKLEKYKVFGYSMLTTDEEK